MKLSILNTPSHKLLAFFSAFCISQFIISFSEAQTFTPGNLVVLQVGDGSSPLTNAAAQLSVVEYTTSGTATGTSFVLPSTGIMKITNSGTATDEGMMTLSAEWDKLIIPGYDAAAGTASVSGSSAATVNRILFSMTSGGSATSAAYSSSAYDGVGISSGTAAGNNYFSAGPLDGLMLYNLTPVQLTASPVNARVVQVFNGQTYFTSNSSGFSGVNTVGTGIPTTSGQTSTLISPVSSSPWGFSISPDSSIMYVADDVNGVIKYTKSGSSYALAYLVNAAPVRGLAVDYSGISPVLYATTTTASGNTILKITDMGTSSPSAIIATAPTNTVFRGIAFSPSCSASISLNSASTICSGDSVSFTISGNPSAAVTYNINGGTPQNATIGVNGVINLNSGPLTANATINLLSLTTPACASVTLTGSLSVTVNPVPAPITGTGDICLGNTTDLVETVTGGTWTSSAAAIASVGTSGTVNGVAVGNAAITYTLPNSCYATKTITVNPIPPAITGNLTVCSGASSSLSNAITGGTWSSSNTAVATIGSITGIFTTSVTATSTATITYTTGAGCTTTTEVTVYPAATTITGPNSVCVGSTITLVNGTAGGTWASSTATIATIGTSGIVSGVLAGNTIVTYTLPSGCMATKTVTVLPLPAPITGGSAVCIGSTLLLHDATAAANIWSAPGASAVATITLGGLVTGIGVGTANITFTLTGTGCYRTTTITVNPIPAAITGPNNLCRGATIPLADITTGGTWQSSTTIYATVGSATGIVTGVNAGTVKISYTLSTGCRQTMQVTVNPIPAAITGIANVCVGSATTLNIASTGGTWSVSNSSAVINPATGVLTGMAAGTVTVSYRFASGCSSTTTVTVNGLPASIGGPTVICAGLTGTLTSTPATGTWTSGITTVAAIGSTDGIISAIMPGTTLITYTLPTGCKTMRLLTVNVSPAVITGPANSCIGSAPIILSNVSGGGLWTTSNAAVATIGGGTGIVTAVSVGTVNVTYSLYDGCFSTYSISVNVTPAAITGATTICDGITTTLSSATIGGLWSSPSATVTVGSLSGDVTAIAPGFATVSYTMPSGCYITTSMVLKPSPLFVAGPAGICMGSPVTLTDPTFGGSWSSSNVAVATVGSSSGTVAGVTPGTTTIYYTISNGCYRSSTITINPLPTAISGIASLCIGTAAGLTSATPGGIWSSGNDLIATVGSASGLVTAIETGTAKISYTLPTGCAVSGIMTVAITPSAIAGPDIMCKGATTELVNATGGGVWTSSNIAVAIPGTSLSSALCNLNGLEIGTATITYTIGACKATHEMSVSAMPSAIVGNQIVCSERTINLSDSVAGGVWNSHDPSIATVDLTGLVTGIAAGTTTITYSINAICQALFIVTVNQSAPFAHITVRPSGPLCTNTLFQNFGSNIPQPAGADFQWSVSNAQIVAVGTDNQYSIISFHHAGTAVVRLSSQYPGTGCVRTDSLVTTISSDIAPVPKLAYYNNDLVFLDNTADFYQWGYDDTHTLDSSAAINGWNQDYYLPNPDFYHNIYWVISKQSGCMQKTYFKVSVGVENTVAGKEVKLYPNPAKSILYIEMEDLKNLDAEIKIVDIQGKIALTGSLKNGKAAIDVTHFTAGSYLVIISKDGGILSSRTFTRD